MPYGTYCLRQRSVIKYHVRFYLSIGNFNFLHLFSYYPIFISHAEVWTVVIGSGNKTVHLIFVQIHLTGIALIIVIIRIIYTVFAVYSLLFLHEYNLPFYRNSFIREPNPARIRPPPPASVSFQAACPAMTEFLWR